MRPLPPVPPANEAVSAVIAQDERRGEALRRGDAAALAAVLSDDLRYIHSNGRLETKAEYVGALADKSLRFERFVTTDVNGSRITPDVVVLRGRIDQLKFVDGQPGAAKLFFTSIWRCESGAWRMVGMQTAIIPAGH
ncbi:MAG TPA: nuclear transport factor 2 family protein [Lacunisphaera sp.]|nr:nuclear transport factor 2 family protein [Lacunisphaera sp.]